MKGFRLPVRRAAALVGAVALVAGVSAHAAPPVATSLTFGYSFEEYTGPAPVGLGEVDVDRVLYYIDEKTVAAEKSWTIFFDAARARSRVSARLEFDAPILAVYSTSADYAATSPIYGADGIVYGAERRTGLERKDLLGWTPGGTTLSLQWTVTDPGDHIRVLTAVPEPTTTLLMAGGLGTLALLRGTRRRRADRAA
jgi:hypothetical protein